MYVNSNPRLINQRFKEIISEHSNTKMQYSTIFLAATLFAKLPTNVIGSCNTSDKVCEDNSGVCSKPLKTFLDNGIESKRADIWNVLSYGHYCGASTKCVAANLEKGGQGKGPTEPIPCNDIDYACKEHDACLDGLKEENGNNPKIGFPLRCQCEFGIIHGMKEAFESGNDQGMLCDKEYYGLPITSFISEAELLALPFCALVTEYCLEHELVLQYDVELIFCYALFAQILAPPGP